MSPQGRDDRPKSKQNRPPLVSSSVAGGSYFSLLTSTF